MRHVTDREFHLSGRVKVNGHIFLPLCCCYKLLDGEVSGKALFIYFFLLMSLFITIFPKQERTNLERSWEASLTL